LKTIVPVRVAQVQPPPSHVFASIPPPWPDPAMIASPLQVPILVPPPWPPPSIHLQSGGPPSAPTRERPVPTTREPTSHPTRRSTKRQHSLQPLLSGKSYARPAFSVPVLLSHHSLISEQFSSPVLRNATVALTSAQAEETRQTRETEIKSVRSLGIWVILPAMIMSKGAIKVSGTSVFQGFKAPISVKVKRCIMELQVQKLGMFPPLSARPLSASSWLEVKQLHKHLPPSSESGHRHMEPPKHFQQVCVKHTCLALKVGLVPAVQDASVHGYRGLLRLMMAGVHSSTLISKELARASLACKRVSSTRSSHWFLLLASNPKQSPTESHAPFFKCKLHHLMGNRQGHPGQVIRWHLMICQHLFLFCILHIDHMVKGNSPLATRECSGIWYWPAGQTV